MCQISKATNKKSISVFHISDEKKKIESDITLPPFPANTAIVGAHWNLISGHVWGFRATKSTVAIMSVAGFF